MKTKILFLGMILSLMTIGCSKDKSTADTTNNMTAAEATSSSKIDAANDDVSSIVEDQFNATQASATSKTAETNNLNNLPSCATVTRNPAVGVTLNPGDTVTKTIDFGTTGCPLNNGNVLKGQIVITWTYQPTAATQTINYQFVNFYHNATKIEGNKTFTRTMSTGTLPHPIVTMTMDMTATFANGDVYTRTGTRTREITAGYDTPNVLNDDIYQVTGNWNTTFPSGTVRYSTITSPLVYKLSCNSHFVQGVISFVQNNNTATLDYGDGTCDNLAVFTINGVAHTIVL